MNINFLLSLFDYDDVIKIITIYIGIADFTEEPQDMLVVDEMLKKLYEIERSK